MSDTKTTKTPAKKSKANRGPRRRAVLILFRSGKFSPGDMARLFGVPIAEVWRELRLAIR